MVLRIVQLSAAIANQIAAGEVIERPASVVKELLENAVDAKASQINIEIGFGGLNQIKISDNGAGIIADDLPLAVAAHATSKIKQLSDLYAIASLGFRGEALASIASISRLTISSKPADQTYAMMLTAVNEKIELIPCARSQGTTVDVRDIFFNAPVRKKFLKSERQEFQAIEGLVKRFAMSSPAVAIQLSHNGKQQLNLPAAVNEPSQLLRITRLLGKEFIEKAIAIEVEYAGLGLRGWLGGADYQRSQSDKQWIYINGRMVRDKLINHALKQAYEAVLYPGKHPSCLLYLTIDPAEIDVNVHPTKHEVRFQQPRLVHDFIVSQIHNALKTPVLIQPYTLQPEIDRSHNWQVSEASKQSFSTVKSQHEVREGEWIKVADRYLIFSVENQIYLGDALALKNHYLHEKLQQVSLPLASRPMLVPVHYQCPTFDAREREQYRYLLDQVGIRIDWLNDNEVVVRSLPLILPDLMIKSFLADFFARPDPAIELLFRILVNHQNSSTLDEADFKEYLFKQAVSLSGIPTLCAALTGDLCREILLKNEINV